MPPIPTAAAVLLAAALGAAPAAVAGDFLAANGLLVSEAPGGVIRVPYRSLSGAGDFWCAAGDYVIRDRHLPPSTRIWRLSAPPRHAGAGVDFALSPVGAAGDTGLGVIGADDGSLGAGFAQAICDEDRLIDR